MAAVLSGLGKCFSGMEISNVVVSAIVTSPVDLVKTRMMNQANVVEGLRYRNSIDCVVRTAQQEGIFGLYKGFFPTWIRIGPHTIICFIINEHLRRLAGLNPV